MTQVKEAVQNWLKKTEGWNRTVAIESGTRSLTEEELLSLAEECEWAEVDDDSELAGRLNGEMHPDGLIIGSGDLIEYCTSCGKSETSKAYFLRAYTYDSANKPVV